MTPTLIRVFAVSARRTLVSLTVIEAPDQAEPVYERRYRIFRNAAYGLLRRFSGGEVHAPEPMVRLAELGLN
jgi:hypothetical protein